jgi:hypothetical protein
VVKSGDELVGAGGKLLVERDRVDVSEGMAGLPAGGGQQGSAVLLGVEQPVRANELDKDDVILRDSR